MAMYGVRLIINIFDLFIYRRFLEVFIGKRKTSMEFSIVLLILCEIIGSGINELGANWFNLITMVAILSIYICQYEAKLRSKIVAVLLYMGLVVIAEPIGYVIYKLLAGNALIGEKTIYYMVAFIMEIFLLAVVEAFCKIKAGKNIRISLLPKEVAYTLAIIPLTSIICCFLLIEVSKELQTEIMLVECMFVVFLIIVTNYLVFMMVYRYTVIAEKQHEDEMMLQEISYIHEYYQDVEMYQEQIQDMKHDMKNKLAGLYDAAETGQNTVIKERLKEMLGDIRLAEEMIYSANPVLNSILKIKASKAKEEDVEFKVKIFVPKQMSIEAGDMGILYGNLLDNALEACSRAGEGRRFVDLETKYQDGKLLIVMRNSKQKEKNPDLQTSKSNKRLHGRGLKTVQRVAEKYGGTLLLEDQGEVFATKLLLTNVECLA